MQWEFAAKIAVIAHNGKSEEMPNFAPLGAISCF